MSTKTVAGPFKTRKEAEETAKALGVQFSAFGIYRKDADGYTLDECDWYVEKDESIMPDKLFGYDVAQFMSKQYK